jgi:hypothetical protein
VKGGLSITREAEPPWPERNPKLIAEVIQGQPGVEGLRAASPVEAEPLRAGDIANCLFPGEGLICVGKTKSKPETRHKQAFLGGLDWYQFIVPNWMTSIWGINQEGVKSFRCLNNTDARRFLVVECDPKKWENLQGAERARYADEAAYIAAKKDEAAGVLGADPATWTRCQFVRVPNGTRDNGKRQSAIYFNPEPLEIK